MPVRRGARLWQRLAPVRSFRSLPFPHSTTSQQRGLVGQNVAAGKRFKSTGVKKSEVYDASEHLVPGDYAAFMFEDEFDAKE